MDSSQNERLREKLKPLEEMLAKGIISQQEFENTKERILKEAESVICANCGALNPSTVAACFNCGAELQERGYIYFSEIIPRLRNEGFDIYEDVTHNDYFFKFVATKNYKCGWLWDAEIFFVFAEFSAIDTNSLREFSTNCYDYAKNTRKSSSLLWCITVAIVDSVERATSEYVRNHAPRVGFSEGSEMPVVYDSNSSTLYYFEKTPFEDRKLIQKLLAPGVQKDEKKEGMDFVGKVKGLLKQPSKTFDVLKEYTLKDALKYYLYLTLIYFFILTLFYIWEKLPPMSGMIGNIGLMFSIIVGLAIEILMTFAITDMADILLFFMTYVITNIIGAFIAGAIIHIFVYIVGGRKEITQTIKVIMYGSTPGLLLGWIPNIGIIAWIWSWVLEIIGIRQLHKVTAGRAFLAVLIPSIIISLWYIYF